MNLLLICVIVAHIFSIDGAIWTGDLNNYPKNWSIDGKCKDTCAVVTDPTMNSTNKVFHITYPKGSCSSFCGINSGVSIYVYPFGESYTSEVATLEYEVYFPAGFNFVKSGKLPGISKPFTYANF